MSVSFACPDWQVRIRAGRAPVTDLPMNAAKADRITAIFNDLRLPDVPGHPRFGDATGEWFRDILRAAFAAEDPETKQALVNEVLLLIPKKNSKTTNAAGVGVAALLASDRPMAEMLILGPTQKIAQRAFIQARGMIRQDPQLRKVFHIADHTQTIRRIATGARLTVKTFDMNVVTGEIPALTIIDELHLIGAMAQGERVIKQITGGMVTNPNALLFYLTTQSDVPPQGVFKSKLNYARGVRDGLITEGVRLLPVLYEFPASVQTDDAKPWRDPQSWGFVNPNLGRTAHLDILVDQWRNAQDEGIEAQILWASQHLNIEVGLGINADSWPGAAYWERRGDPGLTLDELIARSEVAAVGVDGGGLDDLFAISVIGRDRETREWLHWAHAWAQEDVLERRKDIVSTLRDLERVGDLTIADGIGQVVTEACDIIERLDAEGLLPIDGPAVGLDAFGIADLLDELDRRGFEAERLVSVGQGWKLQQAVVTLPPRLKDGRFRHGAQPLMAWSVGNAKAEMKGSNWIVTKQRSGSAKIDALMATFNAAMLMFGNPAAPRRFDASAMVA